MRVSLSRVVRDGCCVIAALQVVLITAATAASAQENADRQLFDKANAHLDLGGRFYFYTNAKDKLSELISEGNDLFEQVVREIPEEMPQQVRELDLKAILLSLGLYQAEAIGLSSVVRSPGYLNKGFVAVDGPRQGLLKLAGGKAKPFDILQSAPANADQVFKVECVLNTLAEVAVILGKELATVLSVGVVLNAMRRPIPNTPLTVRSS